MDSIMEMYLNQTSRSIDDSILKAQFQQKQMQEKEAKLLEMLGNQQQRALEKANGVLNKLNNNQYNRSTSPHPLLSNSNSNSGSLAAGKVRQMFEERRKGGVNVNGNSASSGRGVDKGYPLDPIQVNVTIPASKSPVTRNEPISGPKKNTMAPPIRPSNLGSGTKPPRETTPTKKTATPSPKATTPTSTTPSRSGGVRSRGPVERSKVKVVNSGGSSSPYPDGDEVAYPPGATTTKYSDYASELERREAGLGQKLRGLNLNGGVTSPPPRTPPTPTAPVGRVGELSGGRARSSTARPTSSALKVTLAPKQMVSKPSSGTKVKKGPSGPPPPGLEDCKVCGRFFASDRVKKHESICKNVGVKKRKAFDPTKMRMQGTEAEPYIRIVSGKTKKPPAPTPQAKKGDWRKKHEEFIRTIRAAKEYSTHVARGGDPNDLPPPPPSDNSDYIQCPHCNRKFSQGAAERHIPKCQNIRSNKR